MSVTLYRVGGCVRDKILGRDCDDIDFVAIVEGSTSVDVAFDAMLTYVVGLGLKPVPARIDREHVTIKALVPRDHILRSECKDVDIVLARIDGPSSDGRHPDWIKPGTLLDDLARRDLTINAIAEGPGKTLIDPFDGQGDLASELIRFVGHPMTRIQEDGLRVLRAIRFSVTLGFFIEEETGIALASSEAAEMLRSVSSDRIQKELNKMFAGGSARAISTLAKFPHVLATIFARPDLRVMATMKKLK